jgi:hypothetical protein
MRTIGASILLDVAWVTMAAAQVNSVQPRPAPDPVVIESVRLGHFRRT